jgi:hypothetical protein
MDTPREPDEVMEELEGFAQGKFDITLSNKIWHAYRLGVEDARREAAEAGQVEWGTADPYENSLQRVSPQNSEEAADYHVYIMDKLGDAGGKRVTVYRTVGPWTEKQEEEE